MDNLSNDESRDFTGGASGALPSTRQAAEHDQHFLALAESLPQMILTSDSQGNTTYCCRRYLDYAGVSSAAELDRAWAGLIHPDDRESTIKAWKRALQTGDLYRADYLLRRRDGVYKHHLARAVPTRNSAGEVIGWVGTITDIDDEKQKEDLLRRTEKLSAAGRMAASIAHEINNPLTSVTNALFLALQDTTLSASTRQYLRLADQELARVAQFTTQSLRMHKQSVSAMPADLGTVMDSALMIYRERFKANLITVERTYRAEQKLYCRVDELRQAFTHLLSNSLDAMPHGGCLRIRTQFSDKGNTQKVSGIKVVVADTGVGIPRDLIPVIFDAFTGTKEPTGVGLGLWVVDGIVRTHNGRIAVRSRTGPGHGTVFSLFFPQLGLPD